MLHFIFIFLPKILNFQALLYTWAPWVEEEVDLMWMCVAEDLLVIFFLYNGIKLEGPLGHQTTGRCEDSQTDGFT